jgi:hypothetical protein
MPRKPAARAATSRKQSRELIGVAPETVKPEYRAVGKILAAASNSDHKLLSVALLGASVANKNRLKFLRKGKRWILDQGSVNGMLMAYFGLGMVMGHLKRKPTLARLAKAAT